ncbi:MAG: RluA family pseudouridine synthase [Bdellovibrio sp.]|nr:RluA family pseudouridine synthase [Bdellovibrio sp.]
MITEQDRELFRRLDIFLSEKFPDLGRTFLKKLYAENLLEGSILPSTNVKLTLSKMPPVGTTVTIHVPPPTPTTIPAENIPLEILYEDEDIIFINKPAGMVIHPAPGHMTGTLVNALLYHCRDLKGIGHELRPGIVHRLDMGTTGIMIAAKGQKAHEQLCIDFSKHNIERYYEALIPIAHEIPLAGTLEGPIGRHPQNRLKMAINHDGRAAKTHYKVVHNFGKLGHIELRLETGRTHQIRVHLASLLHTPILNDPLYGNPSEHRRRLGTAISNILESYPHPLLHAKILGIQHPISKKKLRFEVPAPKIFQDILAEGRKFSAE